jgi:hypothetical protein
MERHRTTPPRREWPREMIKSEEENSPNNKLQLKNPTI